MAETAPRHDLHVAPGLDGKVAIVTGAKRGLGAAIARTLEAAGARVLRVDIDGQDCFHADIGTEAGNVAMVEEARRLHGAIDLLVLNAGVQHIAPLPDLDEAAWDKLHDVMLKGPFLGLKAAWDSLEASSGRVVVIASSSSYAADPNKSGYVAAKTGVLGLVRTAALEGGPVGIAVNAVAPAWVRTDMTLKQLKALQASTGLSEDEATRALTDRQPVARFIEPEEVAAVVAFLASPAASGINGACVPVDLGLLAC